MSLSRIALTAIGCLSLATAALGQVFPTRATGPVTDDALIIDAANETRIAERLTALRDTSGAVVEVVTLPSMSLYTMGEEIDTYAGLLADEFGLATTPDGAWALLLVFADDRELRIETGPAYEAQAGDLPAIIDELILPQFAEGDFGAGIENGVNGLIDRVIAPPPPAPVTPQEPATPAEGGGAGLWWILGIVVAGIGGIVAMMRRSAARLAATPCSACGKTGLTRERVTLVAATAKTEGRGETRTTCPSCGHVDAQPFTISKTQPAATPAAAAGKDAANKAQGGGATGKW